jgi:hypothetical protein
MHRPAVQMGGAAVTDQAISLQNQVKAARQNASPLRSRTGGTHATAPDLTIRIVGAMLALAVATVHVADQGGITALATPDWIGWSYRLVEVGGILTALALLVPQRFLIGPVWLRWATGILLGAGPFIAYIASRTIGLPGDPGDVGNWGYWVGTLSLLVEAALVMLSVTMLRTLRRTTIS